jgi:MFS family permease
VLPTGSFDDWGWRIVFLLALPLLVIGFLIRRGVEESPVFLAAQQRAAFRAAEGAQRGRTSILDALSMPAQVLRGLGMRLGENVAFYVYTIFVLAYATTFVGFDRGTVVTAVAFGSASQFIGMIGGGALSDRLGRKPVMLGAAIALGVWAPVFFLLVQQQSTPLLYLGICVGALAHGLLAGPEAAWIAELFPTRCRFAGASLVFQGSSIIAGAPAPFIAVWLIQHSGPRAVIAYLSVTVVIAIIAIASSRETKGADLDAI